ncbi:MAG: GNAT family N-acetyltransferase [Prolixibacteraceae bacterium]|jgi:diamine N-acetyltransferase|nr:GNAT family N-acetyltransferase [Prolixibacteraceae bacterium]MBT6763111.1 GNAT family N-acetyltransferase [Prolixibacteraceae bacterium]MBT6997198.1 GNAT family N-acetyltransferase [Prolixibacteraceae bacterium]MBT7393745.1 GNAT family N-acetyltransferase [Prolixibacteraceae bacterium]
MNNLLKYGKISLRPIEPEDIELLYQWENNIEIWEVSNTKTPFSRHILAQYLKESAKDIYETKQLRLIIQNQKYEPVGAIDLFDFEPYHLRAGVGILVHKNSDRNRGFASDALKALSNYAFEILGLKQLYANIAFDNIKSIRLFENSGFVQVGIKKNWLKTITGWKDEVLLQKMLE